MISTEPPPTAARSALMARVRSKDTKPELLVRRRLHSMGYRYRLHRKDLPGTPDIAFLGYRKAIFVHGCFWHRHEDCKRCTSPKTRSKFWSEKFSANIERDERKLAELRGLGWSTLVIWECETEDSVLLATKVSRFLNRPTVPVTVLSS